MSAHRLAAWSASIMNAHPSPRNPGPAASAVEQLTDLVPGDPPVPITVWRTPADAPVADDGIPARLAHRLIAAYSRPADVVVDVSVDHALTDAARRAGRRHHAGWFTDAASLIVAAPIDAGIPDPAGSTRGSADRCSADAAPPATAVTSACRVGGRRHPTATADVDRADLCVAEAAETLRGTTGLMVAGWPLDGTGDGHTTRLPGLLRAAVMLLRPGGCLVLVVGRPTGVPAWPQDFGPLIAAARDAGLSYLQHIVAVRAPVDGDQFSYYATDDDLAALAAAGDGWPVAHLRVHADLLVFTSRAHRAGSLRGDARG
jgi:hypothetical protein